MGRTKTDRLRFAIETVLAEYRFHSDPLKSELLRREIARRIGIKVREEIEQWQPCNERK